MSEYPNTGMNQLGLPKPEREAVLAAPCGSDAPDPTCQSCGGRGKHLVGYTGFGVAMFQQCPFCQGTGIHPVQPNIALGDKNNP